MTQSIYTFAFDSTEKPEHDRCRDLGDGKCE